MMNEKKLREGSLVCVSLSFIDAPNAVWLNRTTQDSSEAIRSWGYKNGCLFVVIDCSRWPGPNSVLHLLGLDGRSGNLHADFYDVEVIE